MNSDASSSIYPAQYSKTTLLLVDPSGMLLEMAKDGLALIGLLAKTVLQLNNPGKCGAADG